MAKFCTSCGQQLKDNANFCTKCGARQQQSAPVQAAPPQSQRPLGRQSIWGRFIADIPTNYTAEQVGDIIERFMQAEGFKQSRYKGEPIYKKGIGIFSYPKCIKIEIRPGVVHLEAFVIMYLFRNIPFFISWEMNLDGLWGTKPMTGPKRALRDCVDRLIAVINASVRQ